MANEDLKDEMEMLRELSAEIDKESGAEPSGDFNLDAAFGDLEDSDKEVLGELAANKKRGKTAAAATYSAKLPDGTEISAADPQEVIRQLTERLGKGKDGEVVESTTGGFAPGFNPSQLGGGGSKKDADPDEDAPEFNADTFVDTFFKKPEDAIAAAVDAKFGKKGALKRLADAAARVERLQQQLELREARDFLATTEDFPEGNAQVEGFIGQLVRSSGAEMTSDNLKRSWEYAKQQKWVVPRAVAKSVETEEEPEVEAVEKTTPKAKPRTPPKTPGTGQIRKSGTGPIGDESNPVLKSLNKLLDDPTKSMDEIDAAIARAGLDMPGSMKYFEEEVAA